MRRVEQAMKHINNAIVNKDILEVACGCAEFSVSASRIANRVCCIDLDSHRLGSEITDCENVEFQIMDATNMQYADEAFDTVVMYNALAHLEAIIDAVLTECKRVVKNGGSIYIISSFKIDKAVVYDKIIPQIQNGDLKATVEEDELFTYVIIDL